MEPLNFDKPERLDIADVSENNKAYWRSTAEVWKNIREEYATSAVWPPVAERQGPYIAVVWRPSQDGVATPAPGAATEAP